jgi:F0F1-type ATP synthase assembly protein I
MAINPKNKNKQRNPFLVFSGLAFQIGATIYLGNQFGIWLDVKFEKTNEVFMKTFTLLSVFAAIYSVIVTVKKISS